MVFFLPEVEREVLVEDFSEELAHEAVDEEVDGAVDDHEDLRDAAREKDPEGQRAIIFPRLPQRVYDDRLRI